MNHYTHLPHIFSVMTKLRTSETSRDSLADPDSVVVNKERLQYAWTPDSMDKLLSSDQIAVYYDHIENGNTNDATKTITSFLRNITKRRHKRAQAIGNYLFRQQSWWDEELTHAEQLNTNA